MDNILNLLKIQRIGEIFLDFTSSMNYDDTKLHLPKDNDQYAYIFGYIYYIFIITLFQLMNNSILVAFLMTISPFRF